MNLFKTLTKGGFGTISKTKDLAIGMKSSEVKAVLGDPVQTQFLANKLIWKYSLHQWGKGWVPFYLVFSGQSQALEAWYADEGEYQRNQQMWMQAFNQANPNNKRKELTIDDIT